MAMEVILMQDVKDLGSEGDVVTVSDGYARNFLIPRKIGAPVTVATRRRLAKMQQDREVTMTNELDAARAKKLELSSASCTLTVKTGADDKMYGSVTAADICDALHKQGLELERHCLDMEHPIKELGVFDVKIKLHPKVETTVKVWVVEE